jgi:YVTN family beta-propeller protein
MKHTGLICAALLLSAALRAQAPAPSLLVLNKSEATLAIVDPSSGKLMGKVPTGDGPHEVAVSADGRLAFVTNYGSRAPGNTLSVIDLAARKEMRRVDLGTLRQPHGIIVANQKVIFTAEGSRSIARYDPATNQVDWRFETGQNVTHMVIASRDGRTLFTSNIGSNTVSVIEPLDVARGRPLDVARDKQAAQDWRQTIVRVGAGPEGLDLSPDGRELWTAHSGDGGVSVIDVAAKKVVQTIDVGTRRSNRLKFTRDGAVVLISDLDAGQIVFVDVKSRRVTKRLSVGRMAEGILIAPDGRAYAAVTGEDRVAAIDLQKMEIVQVIATGSGPDGLAWTRIPDP